MESLIADLRFGTKLLWKDRGFTITAIVTLTLCIAANSAIFSVVNSVVLRPLPVAEPVRILLLHNSYPKAGVERASNGAADYVDRLRDMTVFEELAMYTFRGISIGEAGAVERIDGMTVTPSFFRLLRSRPRLGRVFTDAEGEPGTDSRVILSHALWRDRFGSDPHVVGKDVRVNGVPHSIVGVMAPDFLYLDPDVRLWRPLAFTPEQKEARHSNNWEMIGRLRPETTLAQAQAQVDALNQKNLELFPGFKTILINAGFHTVVVVLQEEVVREVRRSLYLLWAGALFVLLIGAVNIANLTLARSSARLRELATRTALGAGRWRLVRQLVTESVVLTLVSGTLGLLLGYAALTTIGRVGLDRIPRGGEIAMNWTVVLFILALGLAVGIMIGLIPVAHVLKVDASSVFRGEGRSGTSGPVAGMWRKALVTAQVALALVLFAGAALLLASFRQVLAVNPGFVPERVVTGSIALPAARYRDAEKRRSFMARALEAIRAIPGVSDAGATDTIPLGGGHSDSVIMAEGYVMQPGESLVSPSQVRVSPGYFEAMRTTLVEGRFFDRRDDEKAPRVVIVDERLARKFWGRASPVGKRMWRPTTAVDFSKPGKDAEWFNVVGVVGSVKLRALVDADDRVGTYYFPVAQSPDGAMTFAVRSAAAAVNVVAALRSALAGLDPELPLYDVRSMQERLDESLITRRSPVLISMGFAGVALLLAAVGIYGVLAYMVAQRTKEIGIRMALGSPARAIFELILGEALVMIGLGVALGLAGALAAGKYIQSQLYGVASSEPRVLGVVTAILAVVALIACVLPARRATRVDPVVALRQE